MPQPRTTVSVDRRCHGGWRKLTRAVAALAASLAVFMVDFAAVAPQPALALPVPPPGYHICGTGACKNKPTPPSTSNSECGSGPGLLGAVADLATVNIGAITKMATCGVVSTLFPQTSHGPGTWLIQSLDTTPNYTQQGTNLSQEGENTSAIGLGLLGATMSFAVIEAWLTGMVRMGGGMAGAEGIARGVGAAIAIALWPWAFGQMVAVANALARAVIAGGLQSRLGTDVVPWLVLGAAVIPASATLGLIVGIVLFLLGLILLLGLLLMKMAMGAALAVGFVAMPILLALGVMPSLAWLPRFAFKGLMTILVIPLVWALIFAVFTAFAADTLTFGNFHLAGAGVWGQLLYPLVTLMLFLMLIFLPMKLAKMASLSSVLPGGGGSVGAAFVGMTASRLATNAISSHIPGMGGGRGGGKGGGKAWAGVSGDEQAWMEGMGDYAQTAGRNAKGMADHNDSEMKNQSTYSEAAGRDMTGNEWDQFFDEQTGGSAGAAQSNEKASRNGGGAKANGQRQKGRAQSNGHGQSANGSSATADFSQVFGEEFTPAGDTAGNGATAAASAAAGATVGDPPGAAARANAAGSPAGAAAGAGAAGAGPASVPWSAAAGDGWTYSAAADAVSGDSGGDNGASAPSSPGGDEVYEVGGEPDADGIYEAVRVSDEGPATPPAHDEWEGHGEDISDYDAQGNLR